MRLNEGSGNVDKPRASHTNAREPGRRFVNLSLEDRHREAQFRVYVSDVLIRKPVTALDGDEDELNVLADEIPERIRRCVFELPNVFRRIADLDDRLRFDGSHIST